MAYNSALKVIEMLTESKHQAYFVGGCVRDHLLGLEPRDYDIATSATPSQMKAIFSVYNHEAERFGTIRVNVDNCWTEITTFREDGVYIDGRRPEYVTFSDIEHDAKRRDFTINALYMNPLTNEIIDHVGGLTDLNQQVLRTIGDPMIRFQEDHLRILRAARMATSYNLTIDTTTLNAMKHWAPHVVLYRPRMGEELFKILLDGHSQSALLLMKEIGLPNLFDVDDACMKRLDSLTNKDITLCLATLFCRLDPIRASTLCLEFGSSKKVAETVQWLLENRKLSVKEMDPLRLQTWLKSPSIDLLFSLVPILSDPPPNELAFCMERRQQLREHIKPFTSRWINGNDLLTLGYSRGPQIGFILEAVAKESQITSKEMAIQWVTQHYSL